MIPLYSAESLRDWDAQLIASGMPSHTLMEIAGKESAKLINQRYPNTTVHIYCGPGNNGGDGYVMARWLFIWGHKVVVTAVSSPKSTDCKKNAELCPAPIFSEPQNRPKGDVIVDAMLGTGQNRPLSDRYTEICSQINQQRDQGALVCALDVPTGLHPTKGHPLSTDHVLCDLCLTFGKHKIALFLNADIREIEMIDIGFDLLPKSKRPNPAASLLESDDIMPWWPSESPSAAKWNRGHVAVIAKGGAAVLTAHAAFLAGAGLVSIICTQEEWKQLHGLRPEVMRAEHLDPKRHDAVVFGPGIVAYPSFNTLWADFPKPVLIDAGGINLLSQCNTERSQHTRVLTPHSAEAARLLNWDRSAVEREGFLAVQKLKTYGTIVLKGPFSKIQHHDTLYLAPRGSNRLATAGSGDILAGLIGAFLAKGISPVQSAALGCFIHAQAGSTMLYPDSATDLLSRIHQYICRQFI